MTAEGDALALIAQAAEGSARDGLSMLDQAIAHAEMGDGDPVVTATQVRDMLGLSDRGSTRRLLGLLLEGDTGALLGAVRDQYALGVEPLALMRGLLELTHAVTLVKAGRDIASPGQSAEEREAIADWASQLGFAPLHRLWQLLLKGHDEVASAVLPIESCEMALLRAMHAGTMPDPAELARMLREGLPAGMPAPQGGEPAKLPSEPSAALPRTMEELVALVDRSKPSLANHLNDCAALVSLDPPEVAVRLTHDWPQGDFKRDLTQALNSAVPGMKWTVRLEESGGGATLQQKEQAEKAAARAAIMETPVVKAAMAAFPDAELDDKLEQWSA